MTVQYYHSGKKINFYKKLETKEITLRFKQHLFVSNQ